MNADWTVIVSKRIRRGKTVTKGPFLADSYFSLPEVSHFDTGVFDGEPENELKYKSRHTYGDVAYEYIPFKDSPEKIVIIQFMTDTPCVLAYRFDGDTKTYLPFFIRSGDKVVMHEPQSVAALATVLPENEETETEKKESEKKSFVRRLKFWKKEASVNVADIHSAVSSDTSESTDRYHAMENPVQEDTVRTFWSRLKFWKR